MSLLLRAYYRQKIARRTFLAGLVGALQLSAVGIAVADLRLEASHSQGDLFAATQARRLAQDAAIDSIRERFGPQSIIRGRSLRLPQD